MILQVLVVIACLAAGVLQLLINIDSSSSNLPILRAARRLTGVGSLLGGGYVLYSIAEFGYANGVLCFVLGVLALGQILFAMHFYLEPACTDGLMARKHEPGTYRKKRTSETSHA